MNQKLSKLRTTIENYNTKSKAEPEIFAIFQHKVGRVTASYTRYWDYAYIKSKKASRPLSAPQKPVHTCVVKQHCHSTLIPANS